MTLHDIDADELTDVIRRMRTLKHCYDRADELLDAAGFVADFGTFAQLFEGDDLTTAQRWDGDPHAAWSMLAHWSQMRGDPNPDPDDPFTHADTCDICSFLEGVAALRDGFEFEDCSDCGLGLHQHDIVPDQIGHPHAYCRRQVWIRAEPAVAPAGQPTRDGAASDAWSARWYARLTGGEWALISRAYYLVEETDTDSRRPGDTYVMEEETEYLVCRDLADPGSTEVMSEVRYTYLEDPASMDPRQVALNAEEPLPGEWQDQAPQPYKDKLAAAAAVTR